MSMAAPLLPPPSAPTSAGEPSLLVQMRPFPCHVDLAFQTAWRDLERRSLHQNPFLSSSFLLPSAVGRPGSGAAQLLTVMDDQGRWLAAGLFEAVSGSRQLPLPHLRAVRSEYTFLTGLLIDRHCCSEVLGVLWQFLDECGYHGLSFPTFPVGSALAQALTDHCARHQFAATVDDVQSRATLARSEASTQVGISPRRARSLQKGRRALAKHGPLDLRFRSPARGDQSAIDQFLHLESLGWKGECRTSLASQAANAEAFRRSALSLADDDRIRFAELTVGEQVIASMCLFRAQTEYFAFKIGWDPRFERGCPGFLLAAELRQRLEQLPGCEQIDSCAKPGSFLDHVWSGRTDIGTAVFTTNRLASVMVCGTQWARKLIRRWRGRVDVAAIVAGHAAEEFAGAGAPA